MTKIEALVKEIMAKGKVPGAAVGIVKDGELVYASGFGVGELGCDEPVSDEDLKPAILTLSDVTVSQITDSDIQVKTEAIAKSLATIDL